MIPLRITLLLALVALLPACDSGPPGARGLSGDWASAPSARDGDTPDLEGTLQFRDDGDVSGRMAYTRPPARPGSPPTTFIALAVEGTWDDGAIRLTLTPTSGPLLTVSTLTVDRSTCGGGTDCTAAWTGLDGPNPAFGFARP